MECSRRMMRGLVFGVAAVLAMGIFSGAARADSLSIGYSVSQNQTVDVQDGAFTVVTFTGSVTNNTNAPITFQLTGGPEPFEPYVASFQNGIGFPGITLGAGQSTGNIDLAIVTLQFFDTHLTYPGTVNIVLEAVSPGTGNAFTENDASIQVFAPGTVIPEPSVAMMIFAGALAGLARVRTGHHQSKKTITQRRRER